MREINQIKESELRHAKMMIGYFGTSEATNLIGSYYSVRKIKKLDNQISLDKLLEANQIMEDAI
jgi:hypothetical protein